MNSILSDWSSDVIGCYTDHAVPDMNYWDLPRVNFLQTLQLCLKECQRMVIICFDVMHCFHLNQIEAIVRSARLQTLSRL